MKLNMIFVRITTNVEYNSFDSGHAGRNLHKMITYAIINEIELSRSKKWNTVAKEIVQKNLKSLRY